MSVGFLSHNVPPLAFSTAAAALTARMPACIICSDIYTLGAGHLSYDDQVEARMAIMRQAARRLASRAGSLSVALENAAPSVTFMRRYADEGSLLKTPLHDFHVEQGGMIGLDELLVTDLCMSPPRPVAYKTYRNNGK